VRLSASRLYLANICPASFALPHAADVEPTEAQAAGTGRHAYLSELARAFVAGEQDPAAVSLATVPEEADWYVTCAGIDARELLEGMVTIRHDVAYAYDVATDTARELAVTGHRGYQGLAPTEIPGSLDWRTTDINGDVTVVDFKGTERTAPAKHNLQLGFYALCVARTEGLDAIDVALCYVAENGDLEWDRAHLDAWDLAAIADRLRAVHARVEAAMDEGDVPDTHPGLHCPRCPALRACPAHVTLARAVIGALDTLDPSATVQLTDEQAGVAWVTIARAEVVIDAVRESLKARLQSHPIPLPDGSKLVPVEQHRRSLDVGKALPILQARVGDRVEGYIKRTLPSEVVGKLAREMAPGLNLGVKATSELLWADLDAAGAVKSTTVASHRVVAAKDGAA
jgi:PD-(D/E)XK nuclease superfamily